MNGSQTFFRKATLVATFSIITVLMGGVFAGVANADTPLVTFTAPTNGSYLRGESLIDWSFNDIVYSDTANLTYSSNFNVWGSNVIKKTIATTTTSHLWNTDQSGITDGLYKVKIEDNLFNATTSDEFYIDNTPPITSLATSSPEFPDVTTGWYNSSASVPTITLTCTDNLSGCSSINYAWYNTSTGAMVSTATTTVDLTSSSQTNPTTISASDVPQGDNTLLYFSEDNAVDNNSDHNVETTQTREFKVDTHAPDAPIVTQIGNTENYINSGNVSTVHVTGTAEAGSNVSVTLTDSESTPVTVTEIGTPDSSTGSFDITLNASTLTDGAITATVNATDVAGNTGGDATGTIISATKDVVAQIDSITSDATNGTVLKIGDTINFTLIPTTNEVGATVTGSYNDEALTWTGNAIDSGIEEYTATYTVTAGDPDQTSALQIGGVTYTDVAGNTSSAFDGTDITDTIDATRPTLSAVSIASSNSNTAYATMGDTVTLSFTSSEDIQNPTVTIDGQGATVSAVTGGTNQWTATYTFINTDTEGNVPFIIGFSDTAGNTGTSVTAVTDSSSVMFDSTAPNAPTVTQIGDTGDYINSGNVSAVHVTGTAEAGSNVSVTLGDGTTTTSPVTVTADTNGDYSTTGIDASSLTDGTITATVNATDAAGNTSVDTTGTTIIAMKDVVAPTVSTITTTDSNNDGSIDTATIVFDEPVLYTSLTASDFTVSSIAGASVTASSTNPNAFIFTLSSEVTGTDAKTVAYTSGTATDLADNALATFSQTSTDGAGPVPMTAQTISTTQIEVTFSEDLNGTSVTSSDFAVTGNTVTNKSETNGVVTLTLGTVIGTGDTPEITVHGDGTSGVEDSNGNWSPKEYTLTPSDNVAPTLSGVSIASSNASTTLAKEGDTVTLGFTSSEALKTTKTKVTIDSQTATVSAGSGTNEWIATYTMVSGDTQGNIPFTINYTDMAGNAGTEVTATDDSSAVFYDSVTPTVSTGSDKVVHMATAQAGSVSDTSPSSGIASIAWTKVSGPTSGTITFTSANTANTTISADVEGIYVLKLTATDNAGNTSSDTMTFIWDTTNPVVSTSVPVGGAQNVSIADGSATVVFSEPVTSLVASKVSLVNNATSVTVAGTISISGDTITIPYTGLVANTTYRINVMPGAVKDLANNNLTTNFVSHFTTSATPDTTPPDVPVITTSNATVNANTYTITGTDASDGGQRIVRLYNGTNSVGTYVLVAGATSWSILAPLTQNAGNVFTAKATDGAGNVSNASNFVTITEQAPTVVTPTIALNGGAVATQYTQTSAGTRFSSGLQFDVTNADSYTVTVNGVTSSATSVGSLTTTTITAVTKLDAITLGLHSYTVTAISSTGDTASKSVMYNVNANPVGDTIPPVITLLGQNPMTLTVGDTFTDPGATANDNVDGDITANIITDSTAVATSTAGTYLVTYNVSDSAGNTAVQVTRTVIVVNPVVTPITPTIALVGNAILPTYSVTDATARFTPGLQFTTTHVASVTVNGISGTIGSTITAVPLVDAVTLGLHVYNVVVTSSTGNTANVTVAYNVKADFDDTASLAVTGISAVPNEDGSTGYAVAGGDFAQGWRWTFNVTVPTNEKYLSMKFYDFIGTGGSLPVAGNMRFYSAQAGTAIASTTAIKINGSDTYSAPMVLTGDALPGTPGRQVNITVEMQVPAGTTGGSYSTGYGIKTATTTSSI